MIWLTIFKGIAAEQARRNTSILVEEKSDSTIGNLVEGYLTTSIYDRDNLIIICDKPRRWRVQILSLILFRNWVKIIALKRPDPHPNSNTWKQTFIILVRDLFSKELWKESKRI